MALDELIEVSRTVVEREVYDADVWRLDFKTAACWLKRWRDRLRPDDV